MVFIATSILCKKAVKGIGSMWRRLLEDERESKKSCPFEQLLALAEMVCGWYGW